MGAHPGDDGRRALGGAVAAQALVHAAALPHTPHTLVRGVCRQAQAAVAAAKGAAVEGNCERSGQVSGGSPTSCSRPSPWPAPPTLELAVDILAVGLDIQVQRQCLVGVMGQLEEHAGTRCTPRSPTPGSGPRSPPTAEGQQGEASRGSKLWLRPITITLIAGRWETHKRSKAPPAPVHPYPACAPKTLPRDPAAWPACPGSRTFGVRKKKVPGSCVLTGSSNLSKSLPTYKEDPCKVVWLGPPADLPSCPSSPLWAPRPSTGLTIRLLPDVPVLLRPRARPTAPHQAASRPLNVPSSIPTGLLLSMSSRSI